MIVRKLESCLAISLRADGSIDRTSIDKIYVLAKIVNAEGKLETLFLGVDEQEEKGAKGLYATIEKIMNKHETNMWNKLLKKMSSFVRDGASNNVGEHKGLWRLIDNAALTAGAQLPITKIWCTPQRFGRQGLRQMRFGSTRRDQKMLKYLEFHPKISSTSSTFERNRTRKAFTITYAADIS